MKPTSRVTVQGQNKAHAPRGISVEPAEGGVLLTHLLDDDRPYGNIVLTAPAAQLVAEEILRLAGRSHA